MVGEEQIHLVERVVAGLLQAVADGLQLLASDHQHLVEVVQIPSHPREEVVDDEIGLVVAAVAESGSSSSTVAIRSCL